MYIGCSFCIFMHQICIIFKKDVIPSFQMTYFGVKYLRMFRLDNPNTI